MDKNFDEWNEYKKSIELKNKSFLFKEGDIWWTSIGLNIANESCGKGNTFRRPVLVVKKLSSNSCIIIPLTTKEKTGSWFQEIDIHGRKSWVLLYQIRMMSTSRFQRRLGVLDEKDFMKVKKKLKTLLEL